MHQDEVLCGMDQHHKHHSSIAGHRTLHVLDTSLKIVNIEFNINPNMKDLDSQLDFDLIALKA